MEQIVVKVLIRVIAWSDILLVIVIGGISAVIESRRHSRESVESRHRHIHTVEDERGRQVQMLDANDKIGRDTHA